MHYLLNTKSIYKNQTQIKQEDHETTNFHDTGSIELRWVSKSQFYEANCYEKLALLKHQAFTLK